MGEDGGEVGALFVGGLVLPDFAFIPVDFLGLGRIIILTPAETDSEDGDLLLLLHDANAVGEFAGKFDEELLSGLARVILDHIEVVECELFPLETHNYVALVEDLPLHGFDQVEAGFVSFNLDNTVGYLVLDEGVHEVFYCYRRVHLLVFLELEF